MLKSLYISNYALISEMKIDFQSGFSVLTGETGAGKSIILGALGLLMGNRAEAKSVKSGSDKCVVEAEFDIYNYINLSQFFESNDVDFDSKSCIIRREITSVGKSRAFINDCPVGLQLVKELGSTLLDIHSQHENLLLGSSGFQLSVVDTYAHNQNLQDEYLYSYLKWNEALSELKKIKELAHKQANDIDYLNFQFQQLNDANLIIEEEKELESELETLNHAEEIKSSLSRAVQLLNTEQMTLSTLRESANAISQVKSFISEGENWFERINSAYIDIKDVAEEMNSFESRVESDPQRLEFINARLNELHSLKIKFRVDSIYELIQLRDNFKSELDKISTIDDDIQQLSKDVETCLVQLQEKAEVLSKSRSEVVEKIESYLVEQLTKLGMPNVKIQIQVNNSDSYSPTGNNVVDFFFSANKNSALQPITQVASGGEISRLMLAIKSMLSSRKTLPTIVFDEIDTGVSGEIAHKIGEIMTSMSTQMQVLTITHLPQIAAKGATHYKVFKSEINDTTQTQIVKLTPDERVMEIAQMISGNNPSQGALQNARELLRM